MLDVWATPHLAVADAVAALLHPHGEVVIHDLATDRILAIRNPISGRAAGNPSLLDEPPDPGEAWAWTGPYEKVLPDGRRLVSVSAVLADAEGRRRGLLCVNVDRSGLDRAATMLQGFMAPRTERPAGLFVRDWRELIPLRVRELAEETGLDKPGRLAIMRRLDTEGLLSVRNAVALAATALGVSRATAYALLKEVRADAG